MIDFEHSRKQILRSIFHYPNNSEDIMQNGIILTGGGSLLNGLDIYIRKKTNLPVNVSEDPLLCIVKGTGIILENLQEYNKKGILISA